MKQCPTYANNKGFSTNGHKLRLQVQNSQETKMHLERETNKEKFENAKSWAPWLWGCWFELGDVDGGGYKHGRDIRKLRHSMRGSSMQRRLVDRGPLGTEDLGGV